MQKPVIGNQGAHVQTRSFQQGPPSFPGGGQYTADANAFPGIEVSSFGQPQSFLPATTNSGGGGLAGLFGGGGGGGGSSSFNLAQIKQVIDRLGGIEGIVDTVTKVQRVVQNVQQIAPMLKVIMNSFGKKNKDSASEGFTPIRRRRRKRKGSVKGKSKRYSGVKRRNGDSKVKVAAIDNNLWNRF